MSRPTLEQQARLGLHSNLLSEDEAFQAAVAATRDLFTQEWERAETVAEREMCWAKMAGLAEVQRQLRRMVSRGEVAAHLFED